ncbi:hypothetical protein BGY98DRAFT_541230 [Russula aff. rugulosa BPL654]|nr:hypothetical protein BGY98DRAFT_541230 [Russula aff. rugulosa BPL654]
MDVRQSVASRAPFPPSSSSSKRQPNPNYHSLIKKPKRHLHRISYLISSWPILLFAFRKAWKFFLLNPEFNMLYVMMFCTHLVILQVHRGIGRTARAEMLMLIML